MHVTMHGQVIPVKEVTQPFQKKWLLLFVVHLCLFRLCGHQLQFRLLGEEMAAVESMRKKMMTNLDNARDRVEYLCEWSCVLCISNQPCCSVNGQFYSAGNKNIILCTLLGCMTAFECLQRLLCWHALQWKVEIWSGSLAQPIHPTHLIQWNLQNFLLLRQETKWVAECGIRIMLIHVVPPHMFEYHTESYTNVHYNKHVSVWSAKLLQYVLLWKLNATTSYNEHDNVDWLATYMYVHQPLTMLATYY